MVAALVSALTVAPSAGAAQEQPLPERPGRQRPSAEPSREPAAKRPQLLPVPLEARVDTAPALRPPVTPPPPAPAAVASPRAQRTPVASPVAPLARIVPPGAPAGVDTAAIGATPPLAAPARAVANPPRRVLPMEPALVRSAAPASAPLEGATVQCRDGTQLGAGATAASCASRGGAAVVHPQPPPPPPAPARRGSP